MLTKHIQYILLFGLATLVAYAQAEVTSPVGLWDGVATTSTERTRLQLDISRAENDWQAQLNLLDIGVRGWPAESVIVAGDRLSIVVQADSGPQEMQMTFADGLLTGTWQAPGFYEDATIALTRSPVSQARAETRLVCL